MSKEDQECCESCGKPASFEMRHLDGNRLTVCVSCAQEMIDYAIRRGEANR